MGERVGALAAAGTSVEEELLTFCVLNVCKEVYLALEGVVSTEAVEDVLAQGVMVLVWCAGQLIG